jgi:hypothetical protein
MVYFFCVQLQMVQSEPVKVKGLDLEAWFKGESRKHMQELNDMYEKQYDSAVAEMEARFQTQV